MVEPGLDRHEWETEFSALQESLHEAPAQALPELRALVERMLTERGYAVGDDVADDGVDPEVLAEYRSARDTAAAVERGDDVPPGDVAAAVNGLTVIYEHVLGERSSP